MLLCGLSSNAQFDRKTTVGKRQAYVYAGFNRTHYAPSDLTLTGTGYNFTMVGVQAADNPQPFTVSNYLNPGNFTINQYNFRAGYLFKNKWGFSVGLDQFKYRLNDFNDVQMYGEIDLEGQAGSQWNGRYNGESLRIRRESLSFQNSGMTNIRAGLDYFHPITRPNRLRPWSLTSTFGLGAGVVASSVDFHFANETDRNVKAISGIALSAHGGLRFELWDHLFLQANVGAGYMNQFNLAIRRNDFGAKATQSILYFEHNLVVGWLFKIKGKKDCDCPKW